MKRKRRIILAALGAEVIELGDMTLLPGLMDMELNFLMGGAGSTMMSSVQDDPAMKLMRAIPSVRKTLLAGFTTVRNLGLMAMAETSSGVTSL